MNTADVRQIYRLTNSIPPNDIWRGLGRKRPHLFLIAGAWVCMSLKPSGCLMRCGSGVTPLAAYRDSLQR